jgi:hypothetical protein
MEVIVEEIIELIVKLGNTASKRQGSKHAPAEIAYYIENLFKEHESITKEEMIADLKSTIKFYEILLKQEKEDKKVEKIVVRTIDDYSLKLVKILFKPFVMIFNFVFMAGIIKDREKRKEIIASITLPQDVLKPETGIRWGQRNFFEEFNNFELVKALRGHELQEILLNNGYMKKVWVDEEKGTWEFESLLMHKREKYWASKLILKELKDQGVYEDLKNIARKY